MLAPPARSPALLPLFTFGLPGYDQNAMELSAVIWMFVVLKIPILVALWLIWYAVQEPEPAADESDEPGGGSDREGGARPRKPRPPRRGPHGAPSSAPPSRVRTDAGRRRRRTPR